MQVLRNFTDIKRSTFGVLAKVFGDCIFQSSKCQGTVTGSTCEAKYVAMNSATTKAIALNTMIEKMIGIAIIEQQLRVNQSQAHQN